MSLKAKLEAVIYAAEEPVTLAQLSALFADEAMEWKAEQEAAAAAQVAAESAGLPQLNEAFPYLELEPVAEAEAAAGVVEDAGLHPNDEDLSLGTRVVTHTTAGQETGATTQGESGVEADGAAAASGEATEEAGAGDEAAAEAEAKHAAKLREREARGAIKQVLDELVAEYAADGRGIEIREIAGGYRMGTKPQCHDAVRLFVKSLKPPLKLSLPALETLAVIAYKQPVTAPEVNEIRGVDSSGVFGSLLARKLIVTAGRKPVVGRPILYKTTREFLLRFGLKDVTELPSMEEFEKMAASELDEASLAGGEETAAEAAAEFSPDLSLEMEEAASEAPAETEANTPQAAPSGAE
ncbi:MAG: SMC-Scp complex subunit ScpB [Terracidiphilus sp.]|jgi:segregation and condensation protein B